MRSVCMRLFVFSIVACLVGIVGPESIVLAQLEPREADAILEIAGDLKAKLEAYRQEVTDLRVELFRCAKPLQDLIKNISTATGAGVDPIKDCLEGVLTQILPPSLEPGATEETEASLFDLRNGVLATLEQLRAVILPLLRVKRTAELAKLLDSRWKSMRAHLSNELSAISQGWQRVASLLNTLEDVRVVLEDAKTYDEKLEPDKAAALRAQAKQILQGKVWRTLIQATQLFSRSMVFVRHSQLMLNLLISDVLRRTSFEPLHAPARPM